MVAKGRAGLFRLGQSPSAAGADSFDAVRRAAARQSRAACRALWVAATSRSVRRRASEALRRSLRRRSCSAGRPPARTPRSRPLRMRNWSSALIGRTAIRAAIVSGVSAAPAATIVMRSGGRRRAILRVDAMEGVDRGAEFARRSAGVRACARRRSAGRPCRSSRTAPSRKLHCSPCATAVAASRSPTCIVSTDAVFTPSIQPEAIAARDRRRVGARDAVEPQRLAARLADADQRRRSGSRARSPPARRRRSRASGG